MSPPPDPDGVPSHRVGRRMFGDYPVTGTAYWLWLAGIGSIGLVGLALMFAMKA